MARSKKYGDRGVPVSYNVKVYPDVRDRVECSRERWGLSNLEFFARILEFFSTQDEVIQGHILGQVPESIREDVSRLILERMGEARPQGAPVRFDKKIGERGAKQLAPQTAESAGGK